ncbi:NAD-dependent succinate-semialdehyde dehydrogenase [Corynebacterium pseudopelargi]|uniref:Succinate-semialdehyde dehydrogenase [NADP(+)] GabD n=1 Tax=Corynebacterium pseudopelargi TaxID=2080757 RepID=A0A3G6IVT7_9CORY|nr:NAD-dependent succinate-semialdehyde dehydrogenase [Corynebacterium pseudopelargi]AZA09693.1 Succinate-semialdehyde dehydrogenase [NADP(+)] GabD [Corynebacterium pseudopelargi]
MTAQNFPTELPQDVPTGLFIGGEFRDGSDGGTVEVYNPSNGTVLATVASASKDDAREALDKAVEVQEQWAATSTRERSEILRKAFELIHEHADELALIQSLELGRALKDSQGEVAYAAEFFRWFAEEAVRVRGDYRESPAGNARIVVRHVPVGPCLAVTPWNFPLAMGARKLAPALAAGCTMVVKPASKTPLTMLYLAKLLQQAGVPDGVVAVLPSNKASNVSSLLEDARLRKFTFTGSTEIGQMLAQKAAEKSIRVSLELGGNAPYVVLDDADMDTAVEAVATAKMRGAGQVCIAANRFLVQESIAEEFTQRVVERMKQLRQGPATLEDVDYAALSGTDQVETVSKLVDDALERGATRYLGDALPEGLPEEGYYYPLTVLGNIPDGSEILDNEIFGPVIAVSTFTSDEEAVQKANDTQFGLAAYVFSSGLERALNVAEKIEAGMVAVNKGALSDPAAPFGGVKQSGIGREGGFEGIHEFLETQFISLPK